MCAQFLLKARVHDLFGLFPTDFVDDDLPEDLDLRVVPRTRAPVFLEREEKTGWGYFEFSLVPSWASDRRPKFATHNARLETVLEKPTWKKPFLQHHCLIPLTQFIEPIYEGEWAGSMVAFSPGQLIFAAGVFDTWMDPQTGELVESFAILTTEPTPQIQSIGHDRSPVFLNQDRGLEWVCLKNISGPEQIQYLKSARDVIPFDVLLDRKMRLGWEKRL